MKTAGEMKKKLIKTKWPGVFIDPSLDEEYEGKVLFPEKLAAAVKSLKKSGFPGIIPPQK